MEVEVVKAVRAGVEPESLRRVLKRTAEVPEVAARLPEGRVDVAVRITGDEEMRELNKTYASEDHATDVLSFAGAGDHLGDIAIASPAGMRQASSYGDA